MRIRLLRAPTVVALVLAWNAVPALAAALPEGCTANNDTITCEKDLKSGDVVEGTDGADTIIVKGNVPAGAVVRGGGGDDKITVYDVGVIVCPDNPGPKDYGATAANGGEVDGGDGDDTIKVGGGTRPKSCDKAIPPELPPGNISLDGEVLGGGGNDKITAGSFGYLNVDDKKPNESSDVGGGGIAGGDGDDVITATWGAIGNVGRNGISGGAGKDQIKVGGLAGPEVTGDADSDTITIGKTVGVGVNGGDGDDTINYEGKWPFPGKEDHYSLIGQLAGGMGNDTIKVDEADGAIMLSGDQGDDKITAKDLRQAANVIAGDGNDSIKIENMNGPGEGESVLAGAWAGVFGQAGDDTIEIGLVGMSGVVDGGEGNDTVTVKVLNGPADKIRDWEKPEDAVKNHSAVVQGWSGDDKMNVDVLGKNGLVRGDGYAPTHTGSPIEGADTITVKTVNKQGAVMGGPLADEITVTDLAGEETKVLGEGGDDKITVTGKAAGSVNGGDGADTCKTRGKKVDCES